MSRANGELTYALGFQNCLATVFIIQRWSALSDIGEAKVYDLPTDSESNFNNRNVGYVVR
jgi:hypothetical protein